MSYEKKMAGMYVDSKAPVFLTFEDLLLRF